MSPGVRRQRTSITFGRRSLGLQLLVSWCALLAVLLATFLWMGYRGLEATLLDAGGERAHGAARQLAALIGRSAQIRRDQMARVAQDDGIVQYLRTPTPALLQAARDRAQSLAPLVPHRIALWSSTGERLFEIAGPVSADRAAANVPFPDGTPPVRVGSVELVTDAHHQVFSQTVTAVAQAPVLPSGSGADGRVLGHLVVRVLVANPRGTLAANFGLIVRLVGTEATLALGNTAGDVWTNLSGTVRAPPVDLTREQIAQYDGEGGQPSVGALGLVSDTPWAVWVEFPNKALLAPAQRLLRQGVLLALACLVIGALVIANVTSRGTRPLGELARAAEDIAAGNYGRRVGPQPANEIGQLGISFDAMAARIEEAYLAQQHASDRTQLALAAARMGVWETDLDSGEVKWSAAMAAVYGLTPESAPRRLEQVLARVHPEHRGEMTDILARRRDYALEFRVIWPDQSIHWVSTRARIAPGQQPGSGRMVGVSVDITERKALEDALFVEKERAEVTLHSIGDAVISTNVAGQVAYLNPAAERLTGWTSEDACARPVMEVLCLVDATTRVPVEDPCAAAIRLEKAVDLGTNCLLLRRDGSSALVEDSAAPIHDRSGRVTGAVIVFRDVSAERALTLKMAHMAQYDVLTGLPNRTLFGDRITQATTAARRQGTRLAVLFVDLDRFKDINDSLGHAVGDALLQSVTARLLGCVRESDTVSRRGGDEFVLLLRDLERSSPAGLVAEKIIAALSEPHEVADQVLHATASIGIGVYPDDALDAEALIGAADAAMYHAKESGRGNYQFFTAEMNLRSVMRRSLEGNLRKALRDGEFVLYYQPKVNLTTAGIAGMEALLRWQHPMRGLLPPAEFVSIAEECGLIQPIGRWVLREACRQARAWQAEGLPARAVAVNVSALEFRAKGFLDHVALVLRETGLRPEYLELELTESVLMAHAEATTRVLHALKDLGVRLAIDDFGTGFSSLSYLSRFPIDTLKIDRSFVRGMTIGGHDATIIHAIIGMGRSLKQCVVAEGVETEEQVAWLLSHQCGEAQGFYFSRPVAAPDFASLLRREAAARHPIFECASQT